MQLWCMLLNATYTSVHPYSEAAFECACRREPLRITRIKTITSHYFIITPTDGNHSTVTLQNVVIIFNDTLIFPFI